MFLFGKNSTLKEIEGSTLDRWRRFIQGAKEEPSEAEDIPEGFLRAEEIGDWSFEGEGTPSGEIGKPLPEIKPRDPKSRGGESLIARFGSEIRSALGPGTLIEGKFAFDSPVRVDGTLRGEIHSSSLLVVGEEGVIDGLICVGNLVVFGRVKGHIVAEEIIQIGSSGEVVAEVESGQLAIDLGGLFEGTVKRSR